jgi:hypothetical protein
MDKKILRKFNFFSDQSGIINRYIREGGAWDKHLENTRAFIIKAANSMQKGKACVLGSGWLLDIPYQELSLMFDELVLVDIKHPPQIVHKLRNTKNIRLFESEITGLAEPLYHLLKDSDKTHLPELTAIKPIYDSIFLHELNSSDFVVSVNLLNQLDILICDYVQKNHKFTDEMVKRFRKYIQQNHIGLLPEGKTALITDITELNFDKQLQLADSRKLVFVEFPVCTKTETWNWDFDLQKNYRKGLKTIFEVVAVQF